MLDYPGGLGVFGAKASIAKTKTDDTHDYQATYDLKITYTNETETDLNWELYVVDGIYDELNAQETTICKLQQKQSENKTLFWYSDGSGSDLTNENGAGCSGSAITTYLTGTLNGKKLASGKFLKATSGGSTERTITKSTESDEGELDTQTDRYLDNRKIDTSADGTKEKYYYLIVKYPNNGDQTATDQKKNITAKLEIDGNPTVTLYTKSA